MTGPRFPYGGGRVVEERPGAPALEVCGLTVRYPNAARPVLRDVSFVVPQGSRVALVGANGSGKSTLLKTIAGLLKPEQGTVRVGGVALVERRAGVAYLAQRGGVDWRFPMTVRRLVETGRYIHLGWFARAGSRDAEAVKEAMDKLGIGDLAERQIGELSGGQQQRVLLARALAQQAELLLLDEPLNAVDVETRAEVDDVLGRLQAEGKSVVMATHDLHGNEAGFDGALYLDEGRLVDGPCEHALGPANALSRLVRA